MNGFSRRADVGTFPDIVQNYQISQTDSPTGRVWGGLPYHGPADLNLKNSDDPSKKPQRRKIAHCKIFDMTAEEDILAYEGVMQQHADGHAITTTKEILKTKDPLRIYLEWYDMICVAPKEK